MEQVRLQDAPPVRRWRRRRGSPGRPRAASTTRTRPRARSSRRVPRSQTFITGGTGRGTGEPRCGDDLDEGVGHLVAPDERRSTAGARPRGSGRRPATSPATATSRGHRPRDQQHDAATAAPPPSTRRSTRASQREQDADSPMPNVTITGTRRHSSTRARANFSRKGGCEGAARRRRSLAARRSRTGGLPSHDEPGLGLARAPPTGRRPGRSSAPGARARSCRSCRGRRACRPWRARCASSRRRARSRAIIVSSARKAPSATVVIFGSSSTVDASTPLPIVAPRARSQTG